MIKAMLNMPTDFTITRPFASKIEDRQMPDRHEDPLTSDFNSADLLTCGLPNPPVLQLCTFEAVCGYLIEIM